MGGAWSSECGARSDVARPLADMARDSARVRRVAGAVHGAPAEFAVYAILGLLPFWHNTKRKEKKFLLSARKCGGAVPKILVYASLVRVTSDGKVRQEVNGGRSQVFLQACSKPE